LITKRSAIITRKEGGKGEEGVMTAPISSISSRRERGKRGGKLRGMPIIEGKGREKGVLVAPSPDKGRRLNRLANWDRSQEKKRGGTVLILE